jgi:hypothetical protein
MERLKALLDANAAALTEQEPYFAANFAAARIILDGARAHNVGLTWASGAVCGAHGCSCGNKGCLHVTAWRIYDYATPRA